MQRAVAAVVVSIALAGAARAQIQGRVVMSGAERSDVLVTLVTQNGQIVDQALTSARGDFFLNGPNVFGLRSDNPMFVVVEEEGYKPYRRRVNQLDLRGGGLMDTIYLEPEDVQPVPEADPAVDVRQLQADIPAEAVEAFDQAREATEDGDDQEAAGHLERAVRLAPAYYDAWTALGSVYDRMGRQDDAIAAYESAIAANPGGALAPLNLGALYYQRGDGERGAGADRLLVTYSFSLAREWLERAVQLDPASAAARFYLGATLYRLGLYDESAEWLRGAIGLDGGYAPSAHSMLINVFTRQNRYGEALVEALAFLEEYPDAPQRDAIERVVSQLRALEDR